MRRPRPQLQPSEPARVIPACPDCPHKAEIHNQFGCCYPEQVCGCLKTGQELLESGNQEKGDCNADS